MKTLLTVCIGSLAMLATVLSAPTDESDKLILAGERIGHTQLNMDTAKLDKLYGEPTTTEGSMGRGSETWRSKSSDGQTQQTTVVTHVTDPDRKHWAVTEVVVTSPFFHTPAGVSSRSEPAAIWQEFPDLRYVDAGKTKDGVSVELYASVANGIGFVMQRNPQAAQGTLWGECRAIVVFSRGKEVSVPYLGDFEPN